jgi:hypothetical protein
VSLLTKSLFIVLIMFFLIASGCDVETKDNKSNVFSQGNKEEILGTSKKTEFNNTITPKPTSTIGETTLKEINTRICAFDEVHNMIETKIKEISEKAIAEYIDSMYALENEFTYYNLSIALINSVNCKV